MKWITQNDCILFYRQLTAESQKQTGLIHPCKANRIPRQVQDKNHASLLQQGNYDTFAVHGQISLKSENQQPGNAWASLDFCQ